MFYNPTNDLNITSIKKINIYVDDIYNNPYFQG